MTQQGEEMITPLAFEAMDKALEIQKCLAAEPVDLWQLRELALTKGGLLNGQYGTKIGWTCRC